MCFQPPFTAENRKKTIDKVCQLSTGAQLIKFFFSISFLSVLKIHNIKI